MMKTPISVLIADDHALFTEALTKWLADISDIRVVAVVTNAEDAVTQAAEHQPDIVLMDIDMPGLGCFEAANIISEHCPNTAIIFVSAHTHDHYIERARAVEAAGYVTKAEPPESVVAAVRAAAGGGAYFSPEVQSRIIVDAGGARLASSARTRLSLLTPRELDMLRYLASGLSKKEIADMLKIRVKTVDSHVTNLMVKLDIHDRVELTRFAIREGVVQL
ncbi:MAG: response regulator transcription factor [Planctomycetota bacterium]